LWGESAARQGNRRPVQFAWQPCLVGRPGVGLAWVGGEEPDRVWPELADRVRAAFDPEGVLA